MEELSARDVLLEEGEKTRRHIDDVVQGRADRLRPRLDDLRTYIDRVRRREFEGHVASARRKRRLARLELRRRR